MAMLQMWSHFFDRSVPVERMPCQQRRLALLEESQLKTGLARNRTGERLEDTVPLCCRKDNQDKNEKRRKNTDELSIGLKNDYICSELGEKYFALITSNLRFRRSQIPTRQGRHSKFLNINKTNISGLLSTNDLI
jgi:hypothetical protein